MQANSYNRDGEERRSVTLPAFLVLFWPDAMLSVLEQGIVRILYALAACHDVYFKEAQPLKFALLPPGRLQPEID